MKPKDTKVILEKHFRSKKYSASEESAESIYRKFWRRSDYSTILSDDRILKSVLEFIENREGRYFSRFEFLEYYTGKITTASDIGLLNKFGLYLELKNVQRIPTAELVQLLTELKHETPNLTDLIAEGLLEVRDDKDSPSIGFSNPVFLEFFAAKQILNSSNPLQLIRNVSYFSRDGVNAFRPNWYGELIFLLETKLSPDIAKWLIDLGKKDTDLIDEGFTITVTSANPRHLEKDHKTELFDLIYRTYQSRKIWFPLWGREGLSYFCQKHHLEKFKEDIRRSEDETDGYIVKGNIAEVLENLLETNNPVLDKNEKIYWKKELVRFANDDNTNGVLQRNALHALENYHDATLIDQVKKAFEHRDDLVRQAFIAFCTETDPNDIRTIRYLSTATKTDFLYDAHYGLERVTNKKGVLAFLSYLAEDKEFLREFLQKEVRPSRRGATSGFFSRLKRHIDTDLLNRLEEVVYLSFADIHNYHAERSHFIQAAAQIISKHNANFIVATLRKAREENTGSNILHFAELFGLLLNEDNYDAFVAEAQNGTEEAFLRSRLLQWSLSYRKATNSALGKRLYKKAIAAGVVEKPQPLKRKSQKDENDELRNEFIALLEPEPGKYSHTVFQFFNSNKEKLLPLLDDAELQRYRKLIINEVLRHDPKDFVFKYTDKEAKQMSISTITYYYGDALISSEELLSRSEILVYRTNILHYIPFALNEDLSTIHRIIEKITEEDLGYLNDVYLSDKDLKYYHPSGYSYTVKHYREQGCHLPSAFLVLKSLLQDEKIEIYQKETVIDAYQTLLITDSKPQERIYIKQQIEYFSSKNQLTIVERLNELLIRIFNDDEAVKWRFGEIKNRAIPFKERARLGFHEVAPIESEFWDKSFAKPLIESDKAKYLSEFMELLDFSLTLIPQAETKRFQAYINYIWGVVYEFVERQTKINNLEPFHAYREWVTTHSDKEGVNWLIRQVESLQNIYVLRTDLIKSPEEFSQLLEKLDG